jgi:hypothetical protein
MASISVEPMNRSLRFISTVSFFALSTWLQSERAEPSRCRLCCELRCTWFLSPSKPSENKPVAVAAPEIEVRTAQIQFLADIVPAVLTHPGIAGAALVVPEYRVIALVLRNRRAIETPVLFRPSSAANDSDSPVGQYNARACHQF